MKITKIACHPKFPQLWGADGEDDVDEDLSNRIANGAEVTEDDEDDDDDNGDDDLTDEQKNAQKLSREAARRRKENNRLKKEKEDLQKQLDEQALSRKTKLEQAQIKLNEAKKTNDDMSATNQRLLLENAVLKDSKRQWYDSSAVIALLDKSVIDIDPESGNIEGIEEALADLARDKPFLVKTAGQRQGNGSSGSQPNQGGSGTKQTKEQKKTELAKKWKLG